MSVFSFWLSAFPISACLHFCLSACLCRNIVCLSHFCLLLTIWSCRQECARGYFYLSRLFACLSSVCLPVSLCHSCLSACPIPVPVPCNPMQSHAISLKIIETMQYHQIPLNTCWPLLDCLSVCLSHVPSIFLLVCPMSHVFVGVSHVCFCQECARACWREEGCNAWNFNRYDRRHNCHLPICQY